MATVYVVGAGASVEFGFPVGTKLRDDIINLMSLEDARPEGKVFKDKQFFQAVKAGRKDLKKHVGELESYADRIAVGLTLADSIDEYIDDQNDESITFLGKLAIVREILKYERASSLFSTDTRTLKSAQNIVAGNKDCWLRGLASILFARLDEIPARLSQTTIVCFNYDRCIENYCKRLANPTLRG